MGGFDISPREKSGLVIQFAAYLEELWNIN